MKYHLAWFVPQGFGIEPWHPGIIDPWEGHNASHWMKPDLYTDLGAAIERAGFDFMLFEDTYEIDDTYEGSMRFTLRYARHAPKNDPIPLIALLAARTRHVGFAPTMSSTFYPPYLAARHLTTLDHLTEGRIAFNLVTSIADRAAQSFGLDALPPKQVRYEMAGEWVHIVKALQQSWDEDAVIGDVARRIYADHEKVHRIDFEGRYFRCSGPLNAPPGPQRSVPMVQAGNSPAGRDLTAREADAMLAVVTSVDEAKALREDMHRRLRAYGRDPASCKILFTVAPVIARTDQEARQRLEETRFANASVEGLEYTLYFISKMTGLDLGQFDLDMTMPDIARAVKEQGRSPEALSTMDYIFKGNDHLTFRQVLIQKDVRGINLGLVGSPETVADKMDELMREIGGDGFIINLPVTRMRIAEMCDGVAPILQRRNSIRTQYSGRTLKDHLREF